ncbi:hypothetical protein JX266_012990 [Neoarthrinium moseri]|nr:hypothetical protein JX266_012990 [Neoarthrinium moseri]
MASNANAQTQRDISSLYARVQTLLVKQLQNVCQVSGLKSSGVKADLQKRILNDSIPHPSEERALTKAFSPSAALYENVNADPAQYGHIKDAINNVMAGSGRHVSNGSSGAGGPYGRAGGGAAAAAAGGAGAFSAAPTTHATAHPPVYGQNSFSGFGSQGRAGYGAGGAGASASAPQRPGTMPFRPFTWHSPSPSSGLISRPALQFKASPFHKMEQILGNVRTLEVMSQHRNSTNIPLKISDVPALARCIHDKTLRVMVFCAADDRGPQDIAFPYQSELKVNGGDIKANLRGLKGKPGSTRPVDITSSLRLDKNSYVNNIEFTYALTTKVKKHQAAERQKFYLALYLCKLVPVDELAARVKGRKIPRASVIKELTKAAHDPDVVATSQVLSLKCPLTYGKLKNPCRSTTCSHIQCFDVTSYLYLQEQGPQWVCPICNKPATFDNLAIDEYVKGILDSTSEDTDQVTIEPDGQWGTEGRKEPEPKRPRVSGAASMTSVNLDDDDDIVALDDFSIVSNRTTQTPNRSMLGTPAGAANGSSSTPNGSRKRPAAEVIDLTLSDDDDDAPLHAPKRQNYGTSASLTSTPDWNYGATF